MLAIAKCTKLLGGCSREFILDGGCTKVSLHFSSKLMKKIMLRFMSFMGLSFRIIYYHIHFRYTLFWLLLLASKFAFSYFMQVWLPFWVGCANIISRETMRILKNLDIISYITLIIIWTNAFSYTYSSVGLADKTSSKTNKGYNEDSQYSLWMAWVLSKWYSNSSLPFFWCILLFRSSFC